MAHEIGDKDHMLSVGQVPWHGLGVVLDGYPNTQQAIRIAHLDWEVEKVPIRTEDGVAVEGHYAIRRVDQPDRVLGVVSADYEPVQNADAFSVGDIMLGGRARVETAGSLRDCRTVWMLFRLSGEQSIVGDDTVESYLLATTSHDGTQSLTWMPTNVRVVCNNTLTWALADHGRSWRFVHRSSIEKQMDEAVEFLRWAMREASGTVAQFRALACRQVGSVEVEEYFRAVFPYPAEDRARRLVDDACTFPLDADWDRLAGTRVDPAPASHRKRCLALFECGRGSDIRAVRGTAWAALNAVTEYIDHGRGHRQSAEQSMWRRLYGSGAETKRRAHREALRLLPNRENNR